MERIICSNCKKDLGEGWYVKPIYCAECWDKAKIFVESITEDVGELLNEYN